MTVLTMRDGEQISVRVIGRGKPVILLHGMGIGGDPFIPFAAPHLLTHKFILPDMRGFGRSRLARWYVDNPFGQLAMDLEDIMDGLGLDTVLLGGLSLGAVVGLQYLADFGPRRIDKFLLVDHPAHTDMAGDADQFPPHVEALARELVAQGDSAEFSRSSHIDQLPSGYVDKHYAFLSSVLECSVSFEPYKAAARMMAQRKQAQWVAAWVSSSDAWYGVYHTARGYMSGGFDVREQLPSMNLPIDLLVGMKNDLFPVSEMLDIAQKAPNVTVTHFKNSSHLIPVTEPIKFQRVLTRFLHR